MNQVNDSSGVTRIPGADLTIAIVTWNNQQDIAACLESIPAAAEGLRWQVAIVDNASSDRTVEILRLEFPDIPLTVNRRNVGFGSAHNQILANGVGRFHMVLNPDTVIRPGALTTLLRFMEDHPEIGLAGPKVFEADGSVYPSCRSFPTAGALVFRNRMLSRLFPRNPYTREYLMGAADHTSTLSVGWLSGSVIMASQAALEKIGGFDDRFFMYCEDMDWCFRAHQAGFAVCYHPEAELVHLRARSTDQKIAAMILEHHRSMWKYYLKHEAASRPGWWSLGVRCVITGRALTLLSHYLIRKLTGKLPARRVMPAEALERVAVSSRSSSD